MISTTIYVHANHSDDSIRIEPLSEDRSGKTWMLAFSDDVTIFLSPDQLDDIAAQWSAINQATEYEASTLEPDNGKRCHEYLAGFVCDRQLGHDGYHICHGERGEVINAWVMPGGFIDASGLR